MPLAVEAMKLGAVDFLEKPFEDDRLTTMIETAIRQAEPAAKNETIAQDIAARVASLSPRERQVMRCSRRQTVDERFDAVLRAHGAGNGCDDSSQDHEMRRETTPKIAQDKGKWPARVSRKLIHMALDPV